MILAILLSSCAAFSGRETAGEYVDDTSITTSVKNNIFQDPSLKMFQIHVETFKNQVQLSGFVDSQEEIARAGQIAKNVNGVQSVKNSLVIRKKAIRGKRR
jgi:osmotically-inducible protein OsmY